MYNRLTLSIVLMLLEYTHTQLDINIITIMRQYIPHNTRGTIARIHIKFYDFQIIMCEYFVGGILLFCYIYVYFLQWFGI